MAEQLELMTRLLESQQQQQQFQQQQAQLHQQQTQALTALLERLMEQQRAPQPAAHPQRPDNFQTCLSRIEEFSYEPDGLNTFDVWFRRYESIFTKDAVDLGLSEADKVKLLVRRLSTPVFNRLLEHTSPDKPEEKNFESCKNFLMHTFGSRVTLFQKRHACMKLQADPYGDLNAHIDKVNAICENIEFTSMTVEHFKCLVFVSSLRASEFSDILMRLLNKLESKPNATLKDLQEEVRTLEMLRQNVHTVRDGQTVHAVDRFDQNRQFSKKLSNFIPRNPSRNYGYRPRNRQPPGPCVKCGDLHWVNECPYWRHLCSECHRKGHKDGHCPPQASRRTSKTSISSNQSKDSRYNRRKRTSAKRLNYVKVASQPENESLNIHHMNFAERYKSDNIQKLYKVSKSSSTPLQKATSPMEEVHISLTGPIKGHNFLICTDAYSKWADIQAMESSTSYDAIHALRNFLNEFGYPETFVSDNSSQFVSNNFSNFCKSLNIKHFRTCNPQSHDLAKNLKEDLANLKGEEDISASLQDFLMEYRSQPLETLGGRAPAELMLGRKLHGGSSANSVNRASYKYTLGPRDSHASCRVSTTSIRSLSPPPEYLGYTSSDGTHTTSPKRGGVVVAPRASLLSP